MYIFTAGAVMYWFKAWLTLVVTDTSCVFFCIRQLQNVYYNTIINRTKKKLIA